MSAGEPGSLIGGVEYTFVLKVYTPSLAFLNRFNNGYLDPNLRAADRCGDSVPAWDASYTSDHGLRMEAEEEVDIARDKSNISFGLGLLGVVGTVICGRDRDGRREENMSAERCEPASQLEQ